MNKSIKQKKDELRELMSAKRKAANLREKRHYDKNICQKLKSLVLAIQPKVVHSYLPMKGEIDVTPFLKWLLDREIKVVCPKVLPKRKMASLELQHFDEFDLGPFNTFHPAGNVVYSGDIDLAILPGLAFDSQLNRLGYGGGYYDRFLAENNVTYKVAVLYPFQLVDAVPTEEHDIKMNKMVISHF